MATEISVVCPTCGETKVVPAGLSMLLYPNDTGHYVFRCPICREMVTKEALPSSVHLLRSVGVQESRIRPRPNPVTPLTEDDLIAFGQAIEGEGNPWRELDVTTSSHRS